MKIEKSLERKMEKPKEKLESKEEKIYLMEVPVTLSLDEKRKTIVATIVQRKFGIEWE